MLHFTNSAFTNAALHELCVYEQPRGANAASGVHRLGCEGAPSSSGSAQVEQHLLHDGFRRALRTALQSHVGVAKRIQPAGKGALRHLSKLFREFASLERRGASCLSCVGRVHTGLRCVVEADQLSGGPAEDTNQAQAAIGGIVDVFEEPEGFSSVATTDCAYKFPDGSCAEPHHAFGDGLFGDGFALPNIEAQALDRVSHARELRTGEFCHEVRHVTGDLASLGLGLLDDPAWQLTPLRRFATDEPAVFLGRGVELAALVELGGDEHQDRRWIGLFHVREQGVEGVRCLCLRVRLFFFLRVPAFDVSRQEPPSAGHHGHRSGYRENRLHGRAGRVHRVVVEPRDSSLCHLFLKGGHHLVGEEALFSDDQVNRANLAPLRFGDSLIRSHGCSIHWGAGALHQLVVSSPSMPLPGPDGALPPPLEPPIPRLVVIGNFDGVHQGHQAVLRAASEEARARGLSMLVLTFDPHPAEVLGRGARSVLTRTERKVRLLEAAVPGLSVYVKPFDLVLAGLAPEEFARLILRDELDARVVLVGENFRFGKGRAGDLATLQALGKDLGFEAWAESLRGDSGGAYSSTRIRSLLSEGDVRGAAEMLGRPHLLSGIVTKGDQRGRSLGVPTANLTEVCETLPRDGVYAVYVYEADGGSFCALAPGVASFGARPTVDRPASLEVHLLDFEGDLYGKVLAVSLIDFLRPIEKFFDLQALKEQIGRDVTHARGLLTQTPPSLLF